MFDDKPAKQPNISDSHSSGQNQNSNDNFVKPAASKPPAPVIKPASDLKIPSQQPEDIFESTDKEKFSAVKQPFSPAASGLGKTAATTSGPSQSEPAIKTPPSVFAKKNSSTPEQPIPENPPPAAPLAPLTPKSPLNKKNLFLLIVVLVVIAAIAAFSIWWFTSRPADQDNNGQADVVKLFNQQEKNTSTIPSQPTPAPVDEDVSPNQPNQPIDSDGDGLADEEEILLGTSLNSADTDNDGLYDNEEVKIYKTDPLKADTDNDGWSDGQEIQRHQDPLSPDAPPQDKNSYNNQQFKIKFTYPENMVLESSTQNILQFNDNINQIKLYIYLANSQPGNLASDMIYQIGENNQGQLIILSSQLQPDQTPYSTDYITKPYIASNGLTYFIRYVATKRSAEHQQKFEQILNSIQFLP